MSTETTTVYRVENSEGVGPYADDTCGALVMWGSCKTGEHACGNVPNQREYERMEWIYGFRNVADAKQWFGNYVSGLVILGFGLAEYRVPVDAVVDGTGEVMFDPALAHFKAPHSLPTMFAEV